MNDSTEITLRPNQLPAIPALFKFWKERPGEFPLIVMPPGAGKTVVFSALIKRLVGADPNLQTLILAHRKELIKQPLETLAKVWPEAPVGVYCAALNSYEQNTVTIASRDTLEPQLKKDLIDYTPRLVIIDEAHNIPHKETTRYRKIIAELKERNPNLMIVGFTATPFDGQNRLLFGEDKIFSAIAYEIKMIDMIKEGYLVTLLVLDVDERFKIQTDHIKIQGGEFNQAALREATVHHHLVVGAIDEWYRLAWSTGRKSTIVYCISVAHAEEVRNYFSVLGITAEYVDGKTQDKQRDEAVESFKSGITNVMINIGVFTEGTDIPRIDCILNLRAMQSLVLYVQIFGRGTRLFPGKNDCLILDFGGCVERFGPIDQARPPQKRIASAEPRSKTCPKCETVTGFYCSKCANINCDHVWEEQQMKLCDSCGTECALSAKQCPSCDYIFIKHSMQASDKGILSTDNNLVTYQVHRVHGRVARSRNTNKLYYKIVYVTDALNEQFDTNIMLGYEGSAGGMAIKRWEAVTRNGFGLPTKANEARLLEDEVTAAKLYRPVESITVNMNSKYKDIVMVKYAND